MCHSHAAGQIANIRLSYQTPQILVSNPNTCLQVPTAYQRCQHLSWLIRSCKQTLAVRSPSALPSAACLLLQLLVAGCAGPSLQGGVLQWSRPEGNMRRPIPDTPGIDSSLDLWAAQGEDADAAPACEAAVPDTKKVSIHPSWQQVCQAQWCMWSILLTPLQGQNSRCQAALSCLQRAVARCLRLLFSVQQYRHSQLHDTGGSLLRSLTSRPWTT